MGHGQVRLAGAAGLDEDQGQEQEVFWGHGDLSYLRGGDFGA